MSFKGILTGYYALYILWHLFGPECYLPLLTMCLHCKNARLHICLVLCSESWLMLFANSVVFSLCFELAKAN